MEATRAEDRWGDEVTKPIPIERALEIVCQLARNSILSEGEVCEFPILEKDRDEQIAALAALEDFMEELILEGRIPSRKDPNRAAG